MILIIEDDPGICELIREFLEHYKGDIHAAVSVPEALRHLQKNSYEIVLCDLNLGQGRGESVFQYMRKDKSVHQKVPVLFMSGHFEGPRESDDLSLFLAKPFNKEDLILAIKNLLSRARGTGGNPQDGKKNVLHPDLKKILGGK